ncbi:MAG: VOC family protein [Pseudomonadota bacterium]
MKKGNDSAQTQQTPNSGVTRRVATTMGLASGVMLAAPVSALGHLEEQVTMEKVTGIGGFFFRADDPDALAMWYRDNLGVELAPQKTGGLPWQQEAGFTVFDPFTVDNTMIPDGKSWMINFRVDDLAKMVEQLRKNGNVVSNIDDYPHGRFASLSDPEGNGIQLWEVATP